MPSGSCYSSPCDFFADLRASNVMELKNKGNMHADSTIEEALSNDDMAGREAALSFSGEDMTKAAAKRQALQASLFSSCVLSCWGSTMRPASSNVQGQRSCDAEPCRCICASGDGAWEASARQAHHCSACCGMRFCSLSF